jgi:hypothetical protein
MWNPRVFIQWQRFCSMCQILEATVCAIHNDPLAGMLEWPDYDYVARLYGRGEESTNWSHWGEND